MLTVNHEREYTRLAEELAYLFAKELGISRGEYVEARLPEFFPQLKDYKDRFDTLVLVQPPTRRLPFKKILKITGIDNSFMPEKFNRTQDWPAGRFITPKTSYLTYVDAEMSYSGLPPSEVRQNLPEDARPGTLLDGIFLFIADRGILKRYNSPYLIGTQLGSAKWIAYLSLHDCGVDLDPITIQDADDGVNERTCSLVAGWTIRTRTSHNLSRQ